jgi:mRNA-degrading endonuclease RelE of RelBE toxin-antitoxin system
MKNSGGVFVVKLRIRVGDYRILYEYLTEPRRYLERKK